MKKTLTTLLLSLCLCAQLNFCSADNKNYDEEITLPIGTNFDLEMEEVTRYEYDGAYVKAVTINNKEQFILQKIGDTIINVIMDEKGQKTELKVLVHIVSEQQFNDPNAPKTTTPATTPTTTAAKPATTATNTNVTATKQPTTPTAATKTTNAPTSPVTTPAAAATTPQSATAPSTTATAVPTPTTPATTPAATTTVQTITTPANTQVVTRPTAQPQNSAEAVRYKAEQYAYDVLDLVNAERDKYKLPHLAMAKDLHSEALLRAQEITVRLSHTRPDNTRFSTIMSNPGNTQAENYAAGQVSPEAVVKAWLASPSQKANILSGAFTQIGVAYLETTTAEFPCYWVQIFRG